MTDAELWRQFCRTVNDRITKRRQIEGFDGRGGWTPTFDPPLSGRPPAPARPIRLRLMAPSTLRRDDRGRFIPRSKTA